ncbi:MAG: hypothetical protein AAF702_26720 [Chloroflexota bacterium]
MQHHMNMGKKVTLRSGVVGLLCLLLMACQPLAVPMESAEQGSETELTEAAAAPEQEGSNAMVELTGIQQILGQRAQEDLAAELGVAVDEVSVTAVEAMDWPDSSLGCPEEGMMYAQVITSGYRFTLQAGETEYKYHTADREDSPVMACAESK